MKRPWWTPLLRLLGFRVVTYSYEKLELSLPAWMPVSAREKIRSRLQAESSSERILLDGRTLIMTGDR